jgi:hypothetical protein
LDPLRGHGNGHRHPQCDWDRGGRHQARLRDRQFTTLGNYREFLTRQIVVEGASKIAAGQKAGQAALKAGVAGQKDDDSEVLARTAIQLVVR